MKGRKNYLLLEDARARINELETEVADLTRLLSTLNKHVMPGTYDSGDSAKLIAKENIWLKGELKQLQQDYTCASLEIESRESK